MLCQNYIKMHQILICIELAIILQQSLIIIVWICKKKFSISPVMHKYSNNQCFIGPLPKLKTIINITDTFICVSVSGEYVRCSRRVFLICDLRWHLTWRVLKITFEKLPSSQAAPFWRPLSFTSCRYFGQCKRTD